MANYIYPAPGALGVQATLSLEISADATNDSLAIPSLQDITVNASNDVFTWTQLDAASKKQIATTATNSLSMNLVLDQTTFFGDYTTLADSSAQTTWESTTPTTTEFAYRTDTKQWLVGDGVGGSTEIDTPTTASAAGIFGMSNNKNLVEFSLYLGDESNGADGKTISGTGYITGLAPTVSADSPVWVSPITITVDGDYTVS